MECILEGDGVAITALLVCVLFCALVLPHSYGGCRKPCEARGPQAWNSFSTDFENQ